MTSFRWRIGNPAESYICADPSAGTSKITTTLPDGLRGTFTLRQK